MLVGVLAAGGHHQHLVPNRPVAGPATTQAPPFSIVTVVSTAPPPTPKPKPKPKHHPHPKPRPAGPGDGHHHHHHHPGHDGGQGDG
jgi:hypothetical protein